MAVSHRKGKKEKGEIEMAEGVGNPVYDSFNEGQPLEDVSDSCDRNVLLNGYF